MTDEQEEVEREEIIPGVARALSPLVRRILAANPSPLSGLGTNTYLVGIDEIVVIDPGPDDAEHRRSITGCGGDRIRWIMLTSDDPTLVGSASALKEETGAEILGAPGNDAVSLDDTLADGWTLVGTEFRLKVHHTPGLSPYGICLELPEEKLLFSGQLIVEGASTPVVPPGGDMAAYLESLEAMKALRLQRVAPAHGYVLEEPKVDLGALIDRRHQREEDIAAAVAELDDPTVASIAATVYGDLDPEYADLALATIEAHLDKLVADGRIKLKKGAYRAA